MYAKQCCGPRRVGLGWWDTAVNTAVTVANAYSNYSGGSGASHCWTGYDVRPFLEPCPDTPNYDAVARAVARAPDTEIAKITGLLLAANGGRGPKSRADLARPECIPFWVKAMLGGKGCQATKFPEAPGMLLNFVKYYGGPMTKEEEVPGSSLPETLGRAGSITGALAAGMALLFIPRLFGK